LNREMFIVGPTYGELKPEWMEVDAGLSCETKKVGEIRFKINNRDLTP